jgi:peptidoglycan/xylan/chitin deacetylase (PgdA/CDA1 family)
MNRGLLKSCELPSYSRVPAKKGVLVVSLDFELYWGVRDIHNLDSYQSNLLAARSAIPALLTLFVEYGIHATWATVGMLFCESREELLRTVPRRKPRYARSELDPYSEIAVVGADEPADPYHYARSLIQAIMSTPYQEIGTHTFSHFYCLEDGQDLDAFRADLHAAFEAAKRLNVKIESLVFPRNQVNPNYLHVCAEMGIKTYRGNNAGWIYAPRKRERESPFRRAIRLMDCYFNISGYNTYDPVEIGTQMPMNVPSSRYLRMYSSLLSPLEPLRLERIRSELSHSARHGRIYHLWLHLEGVGPNVERNMGFVRKTLDYFSSARDRNEMESLNMREVFQKFAK